MPDPTTPNNPLSEYSSILRIRLRAERRRARIVGAVFLLSLVGFIAFGMIGQIAGRAAFFTSIFPIAFGIGYITASVQSSSTKAVVDLVQTLGRNEAARQ